jgi:hypothetical protein
MVILHAACDLNEYVHLLWIRTYSLNQQALLIPSSFPWIRTLVVSLLIILVLRLSKGFRNLGVCSRTSNRIKSSRIAAGSHDPTPMDGGCRQFKTHADNSTAERSLKIVLFFHLRYGHTPGTRNRKGVCIPGDPGGVRGGIVGRGVTFVRVFVCLTDNLFAGVSIMTWSRSEFVSDCGRKAITKTKPALSHSSDSSVYFRLFECLTTTAIAT